MEPRPISAHGPGLRANFRAGTSVAVVVLLAGALGFAQLQRMASRAYESESTLHTLDAQVNRMNGIEWEAVAMRELSIESNAEWQEAREAAETALQSLIQTPGTDEQIRAMDGALDAYSDSIVREFALIEQGRMEEAERLDAETVDPLYDFLIDSITTQSARYRLQAARAGRVGLGGGLLTVLFALIAMGYLAWSVQSARRDTEVSLAEERARQESERRYRDLFEANPHPMWVVDLVTLRFLAVNSAAVERYGYSREEFLQLTLPDVRPLEDPDALSREALTWNGTSHFHRASGHRTKEGSVFQAEASCRRLDFAGRAAALSLVQDITDRQRMEEELRQSHKLEAVGRLAAGVAHDFNNILTGISGFAQLLAAGLKDDVQGKQRRYVEEIIASTQRAAGLTQQLLAYGRRQARRVALLDVNTFLRNMQDVIQPAVGSAVRVELREAPDLWPVLIDPVQFEQVVLSLAGHARDSMPNGGTLTLETWNVLIDERQAATLGGIPRGEYVAIEITDTGQGTGDEVRSHIFDPFFSERQDEPGSGLGLAIVHSIVKQSGGFVTVESSPGRGTTFRLHLSRAPAEPDQRPAAVEAAASPGPGRPEGGGGRQAA